MRLWSLDEADAAIPRVDSMLRDCQRLLDEVRVHRSTIEDLRILHGERLHDRHHEANAEFRGAVGSFEEAKRRLQDALGLFEDQGIALKDLHQGLVDFPSKRGDEVVYLCHRLGEGRVTHWHPVDSGFTGRRPVPRLETPMP